MSYSDSDQRSLTSGRGSSSRRSRRAPQGTSYTDRFRADAPFAQPIANADLGNGNNSGRNDEVSVAQILTLVNRACNPRLKEPDLYLNLQIADLVKEKQGNAPREVAMKLAHLAGGFQAVAVLALSVLDVCVKNCGYPFHLAISRRDFLNLLVRTLPERPPVQYSRVQILILEMIEEWNATLVKTSRYRDDLGFIRDMHRLLSYKGYIFPEVSADELAALTPEQDTLKSAAELEREDREAQSAKLQELIRSGTPADLKEANRLMSVMAGFRESQIDYHAKVAAELDKVRRKADILSEMLQQIVDSGSLPQGGADDVFTELTQSLKAALPKIKHILSDKEAMDEDPEAKEKIAALQETVENVLRKHDAVIKGDPNAASMPTASLSTQGKISSLIDIGDEDDNASGGGSGSGSAIELLAGTTSSSSATTSNPRDDLLNLNFNGLSLGGSSTPSSSDQASNSDLLLSLSQPASSTPTSTSTKRAVSEQDPFASFSANNETTVQPPTSTLLKESDSEEKPVWSGESLAITYIATKAQEITEIDLIFSNPSGKKITNLEIQLAPPKSLTMQIGPLSSTELEPRQSGGIRQHVTLKGTKTPKLRWRVNYRWGLDSKQAGGDLKNI